MNLYQHAFILAIGRACAAGRWSTHEDGKPANAFLFCTAAIIAFGYVFAGILNFFLWLGTL
jgi:hypothetical protein